MVINMLGGVLALRTRPAQRRQARKQVGARALAAGQALNTAHNEIIKASTPHSPARRCGAG